MQNKTIEFFWDAASPYTYLAATQIDALAQRCGCTVQWRPFLIGKAFEATGNRAPAMIPAKGKYLFKDLRLWARHYSVPLFFPRVFPVNSLSAQRIGCAVPEERIGDWARAVMTAYWTRDVDISQAEVLKGVADSIGLDGAALLAATQDPAVKDRLRANTDEAVERGAFGAPTFYVGEQMFWGNDRLVLMEEFISGKLGV
ncbi:MAG TPA: 2-hydroxychromene-2-carboxylate isomerase [Solimonas sp.]|nr:2-hydroxychromene-2-carboxylate isomerase [Solimonas sp.]